MRNTLLIAACLALTFAGAQANATECQSRSALLTHHYGRPVSCHCGAELANVEVTLPKGLVLARACNLRFSDGRSPDIRQERISLDRYDSAGNAIYGEFLLKGELHLTGYVRYEPSDGGDLWFRPSVPVLQRQTAFEPNFRFFALRQQSAYSKFRLAKHLRAKGDCFQAKAEVVFRGFELLVNESDEAGISPRTIKVINVSGFSACKRGE
ncbi:hypothetical protein [Zoogloea ramigera]|uniref:hypothetical protein n=1 Tax=Zoogloea ramigera TaxID=350 RepID=UPI0011447935|nr:hypothetical protein [Zoogloea ramigera]